MRAVSLLAGILPALWMPGAASVPWWAMAAAAPLLLAWRPLRRLWPALFGAGYALCIAASVTELPPLEPGERVLVEAVITSVPALDESGWQFDALIHFVRHASWPAQRWRVRLPAGIDAPRSGERWQLALRFDPPRHADERRLLLRDRISAQARMVEGDLNHRLEASDAGLAGLRAALARRIADRVADPSAGALLAALAVGVTGEVSARQWQVFNATGITHLVAISGMHVTFFAMLSMAAARRLWPRLAPWPGVPRREIFTAFAGTLLALLYALLAGFSVPTQRTVVMLAAFLVARECSRATTPAWSIGASLWAVLRFDPLAVLGAGFWLSFLAVGAIVLLAGARLAPAPPLRAAVQVQWLVSLALLPVTVAIFGTFSAVGLLANALAIPVFTLLLVPPILLATACYLVPFAPVEWCGHLLVECAAWVCATLWPFLTWCAGLPGALWHAHVPWTWFALAGPAALLALLPVAPAVRGMALTLLCSVFLLREPRPRAGELWIDVPAVPGTAVLRTRRHQLVWGSGERFGSRGRAFARHVQPLLRASAHRQIDLWLPGHLTRDVQAALRLAAASHAVGEALVAPARGQPPEFSACMPRFWTWDDVRFELDVSADGRQCLLRAGVASGEVAFGGQDATAFPSTEGEASHFILDAAGLTERRRHLRL